MHTECLSSSLPSPSFSHLPPLTWIGSSTVQIHSEINMHLFLFSCTYVLWCLWSQNCSHMYVCVGVCVVEGRVWKWSANTGRLFAIASLNLLTPSLFTPSIPNNLPQSPFLQPLSLHPPFPTSYLTISSPHRTHFATRKATDIWQGTNRLGIFSPIYLYNLGLYIHLNSWSQWCCLV